MCLYTASATPVLPTCCTTRQGPASSSSRMHDSCSCHICTRLQRGIFLLPSPLKAMQLNTHSSWSNTCERSQDESSTQPPPAHTGPAGCCLMDRRAGHPMATTMHTPTYSSAWEQDQTTTPTAGPDTSKATKPGPRHQAGLQNDLPFPKYGRLKKIFVSKRTHNRHPWAVLHFNSTPVYHLWHKVMKGDPSWAEPVVSSLPCCSTEVENMCYWSHKVLTIMAANPVISTDVGKLLTSLSLLLTMQKKTLGFLCSLIKPVGNWHKAFIPYSQPLM